MLELKCVVIHQTDSFGYDMLKGCVHLKRVEQETQNYYPEHQENNFGIRKDYKSIYFKRSIKEDIHFDAIFLTYAMP